eukprot:359318-Chlamydomonas_euryale.AAC.5
MLPWADALQRQAPAGAQRAHAPPLGAHNDGVANPQPPGPQHDRRQRARAAASAQQQACSRFASRHAHTDKGHGRGCHKARCQPSRSIECCTSQTLNPPMDLIHIVCI